MVVLQCSLKFKQISTINQVNLNHITKVMIFLFQKNVIIYIYFEKIHFIKGRILNKFKIFNLYLIVN